MTNHQQIRDIVKSELYNHEFRKTLNSVLGDSTYYLKKDLTQFCELKIENEVGKKINYYREDIFKTIRSISVHDPIVMKNIENITSEFSKTFRKHCDVEIAKAQMSITSHLRAEVNYLTSLPPYEHVYKQIKEENKREIESLKTHTNWVIGSMAVVNMGLLGYLFTK